MKGSIAGKFLLVGLILWFGGIGAYLLWPERTIHHPPGMLAPAAPEQTVSTRSAWTLNEYTIQSLAEFRAKGVVLHAKKYSRSRESSLSPMDIALGWGAMSDQSVIDKLEISQRGRWYMWKAKTLPLPRGVIVASSSNMHILPANDEVRDALDNVCTGAIVTFSGCLVEIKATDGWHWRSSLSRTDEGDGSCEVVWVEHLDVDDSDP